MAWPRKIGLFGPGTNRMPVPRPQTPPEVTEKNNKRAFMQQAVLVILSNLSDRPSHRKSNLDIVTDAEEIYDHIERRL